MTFSCESVQNVSTSSVKMEPDKMKGISSLAVVTTGESLAAAPDLKYTNPAPPKFVPPIVRVKKPKYPISGSDSSDASKILEDLKYFKNKNKQEFKEDVVVKVIKQHQSMVGMGGKTKINDEKDVVGDLGTHDGRDMERNIKCTSNSIIEDEIKGRVSNNQQEGFSINKLELSPEASNFIMGAEPVSNMDNINVKTMSETVDYDKQGDGKEDNVMEGQPMNEIIDGNFRCELCNRCFTSLKYLGNHLSKAHCENQSFNCPTCNIKFKSAKTLKQHVSKLHNRPLYKCSFCEKTFKTEDHLMKHHSFVHDRKECQHCMRSFLNANALRSHKLRCKVNKIISSKNREAGVEAFGEEANQKVPIRGKKSSEKPSKSQFPSLICSICRRKFNHKSSLSRHKRQNHKTNPSTYDDYVILDDVTLNVTEDMSGDNFVIGASGCESVSLGGVIPVGRGEEGVTVTPVLTAVSQCPGADLVSQECSEYDGSVSIIVLAGGPSEEPNNAFLADDNIVNNDI